jgi:predicted dehydrogenase
MDTFRVGIVGLTGIAAATASAGPSGVFASQMPHSHAAGYAATPRTQVVAVCDLVPDLCQAFRTCWASVWGEIAVYADHREMLERERLDILSVVTSDDRHADIVVDAVHGGVRGIFCEKPIATSLADADCMIAAVERARVPMIVPPGATDHSWGRDRCPIAGCRLPGRPTGDVVSQWHSLDRHD